MRHCITHSIIEFIEFIDNIHSDSEHTTYIHGLKNIIIDFDTTFQRIRGTFTAKDLKFRMEFNKDDFETI